MIAFYIPSIFLMFIAFELVDNFATITNLKANINHFVASIFALALLYVVQGSVNRLKMTSWNESFSKRALLPSFLMVLYQLLWSKFMKSHSGSHFSPALVLGYFICYFAIYFEYVFPSCKTSKGISTVLWIGGSLIAFFVLSFTLFPSALFASIIFAKMFL